MKINRLNIILVSLLLTMTSLLGQTEVRRYAVTEETDFGIVYRLPKTEIDIVVSIKEESYRTGEYQAWAKKYLTLEPKGVNETKYSLEGVRCELVGVPDPDKQYLVAFDKRSVAPCLYLREGNLIASVNTKATPDKQTISSTKQDEEPDRTFPALPQDYTIATTKNKRAEIVANYLYELRETMNDIILGRAEQMPSDGEAMKLVLNHLKQEERRTKRLFLGDTTIRYKEIRFRIKPTKEAIEQETLFRFSKDWGLVDKTDLSGDPVLLSLDIIEKLPELTSKEREKLEEKEGLIYNLTGVGLLRLELNDKKLLEERLPLTQFGSIQSLNKKMFNLKKGSTTSVIFDQRTGAIERISNQ